ncbi:MAG: phenylalanine--tRNA ligase subunit beta [Rhodospirillales bacterium]
MKFTLGWLKDHLETDLGAGDIADALTMLGHEAKGLVERADALAAFTVGLVTAAEKHPDADRLQVCTVETGKGQVQVVCGAPNARAGMKGVFAPSGTHIPGTGIDLKKTEIRGVESNGMLLSEREMGLSDEHDGIVELDDNAEVGGSAAQAMGLNDAVIEIGVTPNRGDCLGMRGLARDLAAAGAGTLKPLDDSPAPGAFDSPIGVTLDFAPEAANACPYFAGRLIRGVKNGPSPKWMRDRLTAVGLRPISALVDITNYVMLDLNRPLHVFDAAKVKGGLTVRMARDGENFAALNGKTYALDAEMTVIADADGPEALGGVMGGEHSGCTETTTDVFIESAWFDAVRTAATGRRLNVTSDARFRFERGMDQAFLEPGSHIATRMILELCGGEASHPVIAGARADNPRTVTLRPARVAALGGRDMAAAESARILTDLGFGVSADAGGALAAEIPPWRGDIAGEACLVEEVLRVSGYDNIEPAPVQRETAMPPDPFNGAQRRRVLARRALAARGLTEAVTFSFLAGADAAQFGGGADALRLVNPISADLDVMRPSLLPNLLRAAARNTNRGLTGAALFETGPVYLGDGADDQQMCAGGVRAGLMAEKNWNEPEHAADVFDAKADALAALAAAGADTGKLQSAAEAPAHFHPGRSGVLRLGPKNVLAHFGELHPKVTKAFGIDGPAAAFEVFLDALPQPKTKASAARPLLKVSAFQPVRRDFAFVVGRDVEAAKLAGAAKSADKKLIADARVFDVFEGEAVGADKKSVAVAVTLQPVTATLTDAEIEEVSDKIAAAVEKATGGVLRG